ncbi:MAG: MBL fold metallo-hydrolase [Dehalococcoidia bacterium]
MERRRVGSHDIIALIDTIQSYPATSVYPNAGDALKGFTAYLDGDGAVALNFAAFLVVGSGTTVLVDTGWGPEYSGQLPSELSAAGVDPASIDIVTFTHLHGDHTGWNFARDTGALFFPNARYLVPRLDWEHYAAQQPPSSSFERDVRPLEASGRLELIDGDHALTAGITAIATPGHTPGHTSFAISSNGDRGIVLGDVVLTCIDAERTELDCSFDWDHSIARATREATIARLAADHSLVGASHLPVPGFGRFRVEDGKSSWQPA